MIDAGNLFYNGQPVAGFIQFLSVPTNNRIDHPNCSLKALYELKLTIYALILILPSTHQSCGVHAIYGKYLLQIQCTAFNHKIFYSQIMSENNGYSIIVIYKVHVTCTIYAGLPKRPITILYFRLI